MTRIIEDSNQMKWLHNRDSFIMARIVEDSNQMEWLHSDDVLSARSECLLTLLREFGGEINADGSPTHPSSALYGACHDYISHGNRDPEGILRYYHEIKDSYTI